MERVHQVILIMIITKYLSNKVLDFINPCDENLEYIAWKIRATYYRTIQTAPGQYLFFRDMLFNLASIVNCKFITIANQQQVEINNV